MPRLTKAQRDAIAVVDAQVDARVAHWQARIDGEDLDMPATCISMMGASLRGMYPTLMSADETLPATYLRELYPGANDPVVVFEAVINRLSQMSATDLDALLTMPIFAFLLNGSRYESWSVLAGIDNYFGMLNAEKAHHLYWINTYLEKFRQASQPLQQAQASSKQRTALLEVFARAVFITCCPHIMGTKFYRWVLGIKKPKPKTMVVEDAWWSAYDAEYYPEEPGTLQACGMAEIELLSQLLPRFMAEHPDVAAHIQNGA